MILALNYKPLNGGTVDGTIYKDLDTLKKDIASSEFYVDTGDEVYVYTLSEPVTYVYEATLVEQPKKKKWMFQLPLFLALEGRKYPIYHVWSSTTYQEWLRLKIKDIKDGWY